MSIVNEIKCARCDRKYSGVRSRCPYCGARRIGRGKYTEDSDNAKGKMLISILIMAVFAVGMGILLISNPVEADAGNTGNDQSIDAPDDDEDDDLFFQLPPEEPFIEDPPEEPMIEIHITSLVIFSPNGPSVERDKNFTMWVGDRDEPLNFRVEPPGAESGMDIKWWSGDEDIAEITPVPGTNGGASVKAISRGSVKLFLAVGDFEDEITVHVRERG